MRHTNTEIIYATAAHFGLTPRHIIGVQRTKSVVYARQISQYVSRWEGYTFPEIARVYNRDHTSVMNSVRKIGGLHKADKETADHIHAVWAVLDGVDRRKVRQMRLDGRDVIFYEGQT